LVAQIQILQLETRLELGILRLAEGRVEEAASHFARAEQAAANRPEPSVDEIVMLAGVQAQLSRIPDAVVVATLGKTPNSAAGAKAHADRAVTLLTRAIDKGFGDTFLLTKSDAYEPLRDRDDFKKLLAGLEAKAKEQDTKQSAPKQP
jgi:hypothetical protein